MKSHLTNKTVLLLTVILLTLSVIASVSADGSVTSIPFRFASAEEGRELMLANEDYYRKFTPNKLEFIMPDSDADMDEYLAFAGEQLRDWTEPEKAAITGVIAGIESTFDRNGWKLPPLETVVFIKTTMAEEGYVAGYTHGTQIYLTARLEERVLKPEEQWSDYLFRLISHELFHCLTRSSAEFRKDMYEIIHFTTAGADFELPPSVLEYYIANPDVEHHDAYASFVIGGEQIDCFTAFVTKRHYEEGDQGFFSLGITALVPTDGSDVWYKAEDAANFSAVFGENTEYVIDPEECMADNFTLAVVYGKEGPYGDGYPTPEIIDAIYACLSNL